jgi:NAD+--asparagine ADP-ribosyltransferase
VAFKETTSEVAKSSGGSKLEVNPNKRLSPGVRETKPGTSDAISSEAVNPNKRIEPAHIKISGVEAETYKRIPLETSSLGEWLGRRGDSTFVPNDPDAKKELRNRGLEGIEYKKGDPDFSPIAEAQVQIKGFTDRRKSTKDADGVRIVGNYEKAESALARQWNSENRDGRSDWTRQEVKTWRDEHGLTWHECRDMKTMQLVPTATHEACRHTGGVSEYKKINGGNGGFDD